jgi:hypothetical protein
MSRLLLPLQQPSYIHICGSSLQIAILVLLAAHQYPALICPHAHAAIAVAVVKEELI